MIRGLSQRPELRAALRRNAEAAHAAFRGPRSLGITVVTAAILLVVALEPGTRDALGISALDGGAVLGGFLAITLLAALAHVRLGFQSRVYALLNGLESAWAMWGSLYLVHASGSAISFFWVVYLGVCVQNGSFGHNLRLNAVLSVLGPSAVAVAFAARGDASSASLTLVAGGVALASWGTTLRSALQVAQGLVARDRLEAQQRDLLVLQERERIARDLHDGLGAELTGLLYRVRMNEALPEEVRQTLETRLTESIDELRSVVWVLRNDDQALAEMVAWLRTRCADLCAGDVALEIDAPGSLSGTVLPGELRMHLVRLVLESVRNAVRHGAPKRVNVSFALGKALEVAITDDGAGLAPHVLGRRTGGLANLLSRSAAVGGALDVTSSPAGTSVRFRCPVQPAKA